MRVLVVEDEVQVARFLRQALEEEGHTVDTAGDGVEANNQAHLNSYDLILLDVQLPRMDGLQVAAELRRSGLQCPILMLTSRDSTQDVVRGLNAGADDYLTKPFALEELLARVNAITRRQLGPATGVLRYQDLEMDRLQRVVKRGGHPLDFSPREFRLLEFLMSRPGVVFSREQLLDAVWGHDRAVTDRTVDVYVLRLRQKIEQEDAEIRPRFQDLVEQ